MVLHDLGIAHFGLYIWAINLGCKSRIELSERIGLSRHSLNNSLGHSSSRATSRIESSVSCPVNCKNLLLRHAYRACPRATPILSATLPTHCLHTQPSHIACTCSLCYTRSRLILKSKTPEGAVPRLLSRLISSQIHLGRVKYSRIRPIVSSPVQSNPVCQAPKVSACNHENHSN